MARRYKLKEESFLSEFNMAENMMDLLDKEFNQSDDSKSKTSLRKKNAKEFLEKDFKSIDSIYSYELEMPDKEDGYGMAAWRLFNTIHKKIPCEYYSDNSFNIDLLDYLRKHGELIAKKFYYNETYGDSEFYFLFNYKEMFIYFSYIYIEEAPEGVIQSLAILYSVGNLVDLEKLNSFIKKPKETPKIGIIKTTKYGPAVSWMEHKTDYTFTEDNYNEDFPAFYKDLESQLKTNKTGLYLLYGEAGTGKSSAIRQLISDTDRKVVFVPPQMINCLASPDFTDLVLSALKGSILVIEDAEKALMKRESEDGFHNSELVSTILNLTDGLYSDLAHISIIATYNCDRNLIDPALLRKGRLRSEYHFKKLSIDRCQKLMDSLEKDIEVEEEMTLAEIFNHEKQFSNRKSEKKRSVGFGG
jgi:hypothetical protein